VCDFSQRGHTSVPHHPPTVDSVKNSEVMASTMDDRSRCVNQG
jgi:hypothetical protein